MRTPPWLERHDESAARRAALLPLSAAALVYGLAARADRALYRRGWRTPRALPCRVVSVGSLAVGGSGKTPLAAELAAALHARGHRVALASRGYGRSAGAEVEVVSDGARTLVGADRAGDEPVLLAAHAPGVPVVVARDRGLAGLHAVRAFGCELLVLDDGFQHHRLRRDVDLVVFDGAAGFGNGAVLPRGPLREPASALRVADAIVVMDGPLRVEDEARAAALAPHAARFEARREPAALRPLGGGAEEAPAALRGRDVGMLCGIARPVAFRNTLEALGARVVRERVFADHHPYAARDLAGLAGEAPLWVTTEKDAVKLDRAWAKDVPLVAVVLRVAGADALAGFAEERLAQPRPAAR